jgi:hypothetical protein
MKKTHTPLPPSRVKANKKSEKNPCPPSPFKNKQE